MKITSLLIAVLLILALPFAAMAAEEAAGTIIMEYDLSGHATEKSARLWIPYPLSDQNQSISNISISGDYAEAGVYSDRKYSTPMLYARWDEGATSRKLVFSFQAVRQEVVKKDFPATEVAWDPADYALYLEPTSLGPIDGAVKELADTIVAGKATVLDKARAIYDWISENMYRNPGTLGCGSGDVCLLLANPGGKCTDIHSVFVALARASMVPAREIFGIRLGKNDAEDITQSQHCWAEFYLPGYGWVPVDPADVLKMMLKYDLKPDDRKTREYREYFWGAWDQYRVQLAVGRDVDLNPLQSGMPLNTFGYPYAEIGGEPVDWLDPANFKYSITYKQQPES